ncbi:serine/threonine protein kinase [Nibricoccus aquaticus]|uniref:Serine/threonine protein kinase n=1 Tax=Nibricoccus aquaticus TaxID=2576891 RepID=A0A290Q6Y1_9BACT|nr:DEAD/DEAH box helicase [Nibricoccus aquaticus]ATC62930.1 serine/threonine protein kinase [Nibricoccus aquaticus]
MLRLLLPPNLAEAAPRNAIALKVELDLNAPPKPALFPALAVLQRLCGSEKPPAFIQLTRVQLRELVTAATGQPVFAFVNTPHTNLLWLGQRLRGVSEHLTDPADPRPTSTISVPRSGSIRTASPEPRGLRPSTLSSQLPTPSATTSLMVDGSEHFLSISLPSRESLSYAPALDVVKTAGFVLEPSSRKWWLRDRHKVLNFLATHGQRLRDELFAEFTDNFEKNTARFRHAEIACDAIDNGNGYNVTLALRAGRVSEDQILAAASGSRGYVEDNGQVYLIAPEQLQKLAEAQRALSSEGGVGSATRRTHRVSTARLIEAEGILEKIAPHFQPPEAWKARSNALRNLSALNPAPIPPALDALLRPYQKIGVAWLWHLHRHNLGGILADEMGLGKTLQALSLLSALNSQPTARNASRVSLVACPASLVENWRREAARFAPELRVFVHHGSNRLTDAKAFAAHDLIITSYGTLARDRDLFSETDFSCLIADEAQHLKNRRSQNAQALRILQAQGRFLLTGTPLENSIDDLRSLFEVLMPGYIDQVPSGTKAEERNWFDERLRAKTAPYILRRTKKTVAPELPSKIEQILYCELSPAQSALYRKMQEETERALLDLEASGANDNSVRMATLTQLLRLRQVCCDPRLLPQSTNKATDSAKLEAFRELLAESIDDGHRLLVFSQFTALLGLLREELESQEIPYAYLDGSMTPKARQAEVDKFNTSTTLPVFLISLKAGGTGLNLTSADTVVHFDPWWNPAVEAQATDRAHRIGQTKVVTSYKLICSGTVEEKVLQLQESKRALLADVFEASDAVSAKLTLADLRSLLTS